MSGNIELNPGPVKEVLDAIKSLEDKIEARHTEVMASLNEVKSSQKVLEESVLNINIRLAAVEEKVATLEASNTPSMERIVAEAVKIESASLESKLDDHEDRSRRDKVFS